MWKLLKFLLWTGLAVWVGILLATHEIASRTPVQHFQRAWKRNGASAKLDELKNGIHGVVDDAKDALSSAWDKKPKERHSPEDREAVNKLVAKGNGAK